MNWIWINWPKPRILLSFETTVTGKQLGTQMAKFFPSLKKNGNLAKKIILWKGIENPPKFVVWSQGWNRCIVCFKESHRSFEWPLAAVHEPIESAILLTLIRKFLLTRPDDSGCRLPNLSTIVSCNSFTNELNVSFAQDLLQRWRLGHCCTNNWRWRALITMYTYSQVSSDITE